MVYGNERLVCLFSHVIGDSPFDVFKQVLQTYFGQPQLESFCSVCSSDIEPLNLLYLKYFSFLSDICLLLGTSMHSWVVLLWQSDPYCSTENLCWRTCCCHCKWPQIWWTSMVIWGATLEPFLWCHRHCEIPISLSCKFIHAWDDIASLSIGG